MSRFSAPRKVVLLGDTNVGKTSIMMRLCDKDFSDSTVPSIGSTFTRIGPAEFPFQIWDTAGQEKYRSLTPIAVRGAEIVILVFDITREPSFESLNDWLDMFVNYAGSSLQKIILTGNKSDLRAAARVSRDAAQEAAASFCDRIRGVESVFIETSAKTGDGIDELKDQLEMVARIADGSRGEPVIVINSTIAVEEKSKCC
jgi:small GTP-binding protein